MLIFGGTGLAAAIETRAFDPVVIDERHGCPREAAPP